MCPKAQRNFTDTESRIIPAPGGKDFLQVYNCQAVVDSAHQVRSDVNSGHESFHAASSPA